MTFDVKKIGFSVKGMTCAACVAHVERAARTVLKDLPFTVSLLSGTLTLTLPDGQNEKEIFSLLKKALTRAGYGLAELQHEDPLRAEREEKGRETRRLIYCIVLSALLMAVAMWHMTPLPPPFILDGAKYPRAFFTLQLVLTLAVVFLQRRFYKNGFSALAMHEQKSKK